MPIIKWNPWDDMDKIFEDFGRFPAVNKKPMDFIPAVNVYQEKNNVVVETSLAGIDPKDVDVSIEDDVLIVKGKSEKKTEVDEKNYYHKEMSFGSFYRSIPLPAHVKGDKAKASFENGILKIEVPKEAEKESKTIKIEVKKK
ncbi:MAG: Hsp20/alpha crystallin family protein [Patescibacteria group bacterium]